MIVPEFWAEGRVQHKADGRQVTVRRFGWSDVSQEEAQDRANARAQEAMQRIWSGEKLDRREPKVAYNGAEGVPIREEIVSRHGEVVITRNGYGALCINTPNVLFVDVDVQEGVPRTMSCSVLGVLLLVSIGYGLVQGSWSAFMMGVAGTLILGWWMAGWLFRLYEWFAGGAAKRARKRMHRFSSAHPDWHLRIYETPAGFRVMVLHEVFDPVDERVAECFKSLRADEVYVRMCRRQHCFRARVSPKPWRIGIKDHLPPQRGGWPVKPELMPRRKLWVEEYEARSAVFSSCRFVEQLGSLQLHLEAERVMRLHDDLAKAHSGLPMG
ncbi:hypothetical protein FEM03_18540 [Phragmitibacter flavus]|uniref:Transmembrane protein n=1 Tax=Phragmitibacter flavus TaxID=2576071 RepID=A0A5R8KAS7_9BACT|nr:hypothetical protein [Phragmitibacter flavus]TLD69367.1 hypothetical protein FEM03_18540 [Phragmitibacter flavus]